MKIRILRNLGRGWPDLSEGQTFEVGPDSKSVVDEKFAERLFAAGLAVSVDDEPPRKKPAKARKGPAAGKGTAGNETANQTDGDDANGNDGQFSPESVDAATIDGLRRKTDALELAERLGLVLSGDQTLAELKAALADWIAPPE